MGAPYNWREDRTWRDMFSKRSDPYTLSLLGELETRKITSKREVYQWFLEKWVGHDDGRGHGVLSQDEVILQFHHSLGMTETLRLADVDDKTIVWKG